MPRRSPKLGDAVFRQTMTEGLGQNTFQANTKTFGPGDFVKLALEYQKDEHHWVGERCWFEVIRKEEAAWVGICNNNPISTQHHGVAFGDEVLFEARHVFQVYEV